MSYLKNTAGQKVSFLAYSTATGLPVAGDSANITAQISIDFATPAALADVNPTELDATNFPGQYVFDLSQAETNGDVLSIVAESATANVQLDGINIYTTDLQVLEDTIWDASYGDHNSVGSTGRSVGNIATVQNSIDVVDANVDAILVDTNELQGNQGDWATATGFATAISLGVTDGKVTSILTDTGTTIPAQISALNDFNPASDTVANVTLVGTCTTNTDMRGTDNAAAASSLSITNSSVNTIKAVTNNLPDSGALSSLSTAASISALNDFDPANDVVARVTLVDTTTTNTDMTTGTSPSAIYTYFTDASREDVFKADVSLLATASSLAGVEIKVDGIKNQTDQLVFSIPNQVDANALTGGGGGSGSIEKTITVCDNSSNPLDGVAVWVSTDIAGTNVVAGKSYTDAFGNVTFMLDAGTYYGWQQLAGYNFTNPTSFTVS